MLRKLEKLYIRTTGKVQIACNGLSALRQAQSQKPIDPNMAHYDLIGAIQTLRNELPIQLTFEHMKGHQDSGTLMVLTRLTSMNMEMDSIAKWMIDRAVVGPIRYKILGEPWLLRRQTTDMPSGS